MVTHKPDHPVCGIKVGFAEIFLMPQPPLLTEEGNTVLTYRQAAIAFCIPAAFCSVSSYSHAGSESATIPLPTW